MAQASAAPSPEVRREEILDRLEAEGETSIEALAARFGVSGMTIRRDLQELADSGQVIRTHGGAAPAKRISFEFRFLERARQQADEKNQIAELAMAHIHPGDSVLLDSSTTTLAIARRLVDISDLTVVTTSLPIASALFGRDTIRVIILGGALRQDSPDLVGALTDSNLEQIHADVAFIGVDALDEQGVLYNRSPDLGRMLQHMAGAADRVFAVADHTKVGRRELMRFGSLRDWQGLISDDALEPAMRKRLERHGCRVITPGHAAAGGRDAG
ncbi:MAG: DeoR/GlpR family DNA-binding transcription regulator [Planctomycetota bacterium]